ncbi:sigma-70 family RNA polymerase sigma factor [Virgibacillus ndiopensis]|uniref:sigma-70 family RNA polymerase sigma factor n=1 Tax=Virgibacillus ndiopensis TaxID=2004408 RepID=UPI000C06BFFA|nr:sigma-70 family RNA polymerase sigma factor [Virgibacillus ndiopensis]
MNDEKKFTFEEIFKQNERRIHYQLHRLHIYDPHKEFYQGGLCAMWNAYEKYQPDKGPMATYFNYMIRNRLIDKIRKETRDTKHTADAILEEKTVIDDGNHQRSKGNSYPIPNFSDPLMNDPNLWQNLKAELTENQWKWVYFFIIGDMSVKDIAIQENTTEEAVKSWGQQVRKKLKDADFRKRISWDV